MLIVAPMGKKELSGLFKNGHIEAIVNHISGHDNF